MKANTDQTPLETLRAQIDMLDDSLVQILSARFDLVRQIGIYKKREQINPLDEKRRQEVTKRLEDKAAQSQIPKQLIQDIYKLIHEYSLKEETNEQ